MIPTLPPAVAFTWLAITIVAAYTDLRWRKIPNWLTASGFVAGLALQLGLFGARGLRTATLGCCLALAIYVPLFALRATGAGDVKLMAVLGAFLGTQLWLLLFVLTAVTGGIAALGLLLLRGSSTAAFVNASFILGELLQGRLPYRSRASLDIQSSQAITLPHALPVLVATILLLYGFPFSG